jgi:hypothetical protein
VVERRAYHKPTTDELEERTEYVRTLLLQRHPTSVIKRLVRQRYRDLAARTIQNYIARARQLLLIDVHRAKVDQRALSLATYESIIAKSRASDVAIIKAQERIDKLLGLEERIPDDPRYLLEQLGIRPEEIAALPETELSPEPVALQGPVAGPGPVRPGPDPLCGTDPAGAVVAEAVPDRPGAA